MSFLRKIFTSLKQSFLEEFSSVKLAITLFVFLAITTLIGTILPEEPMVGAAALIKKYGLNKYHLFKSLGLTDVFHSWWYLALLTALGLNLIIASFVKVFPRCGRAFSWPVKLDVDAIKKLPINCEIEATDSFPLSVVDRKLKNKNYKTKIENELLIGVKGAWHRLGASVTHVGILTLLVGSTISIVCGFNGMAQVGEDEGFYLADLRDSTTQIRSVEPTNWLVPISKMPIWFGHIPPYLVRVNKTWRIDYKTGQPKQWYTDLSVLDQNKTELKRKTIHVNEPLEFMGLDIYQSNWGRFLELTFNNEPLTIPLEKVRGKEIVILPLSDDVGLKLEVKTGKAKTVENKEETLKLYSVSLKTFQEKYLNMVPKNKDIKLGPINIGFLGTQTLTGLQFKSNPGNTLIYPGLLLIIIGVFIAFGSKKQVWAVFDSINNKIIIGGTADRAKGKFFEEFEGLVSDMTGK